MMFMKFFSWTATRLYVDCFMKFFSSFLKLEKSTKNCVHTLKCLQFYFFFYFIKKFNSTKSFQELRKQNLKKIRQTGKTFKTLQQTCDWWYEELNSIKVFWEHELVEHNQSLSLLNFLWCDQTFFINVRSWSHLMWHSRFNILLVKQF
jgi:amino acid permease